MGLNAKIDSSIKWQTIHKIKPSIIKCTKKIRTLSYEAIEKQLEDGYKEVISLRIKQATRQEFKPSDVRNQKKQIARLLTVRREMQIADGISNTEYKWEKTLKKLKFL